MGGSLHPGIRDRHGGDARGREAGRAAGEYRVNATRVGVRRPFARFDPTPRHVIAAMLELADVREHDLVYDLGCGDGRIVIAAARERGASAVGIEIHAGRIAQARENARAADVAHSVRFINDDLFEADIRPASVVTLFLLPEVNVLLRPRLLRELAPGTRIVSYLHGMGRWRPQRTRTTVDRLGWQHRMYLWTVPSAEAGPDLSS